MISRRVMVGNNAILFQGDCRELLPELGGDLACITDPPYGINYTVNARSWDNKGLAALEPFQMAKKQGIHGDKEPFDATPLLRFAKVAIFGANHMHLPIGGRWIVWDKRRDSTPDDHPDCEMVWTNVPGADRIHRQKWRGIVREGEENTTNGPKLHPNQKPVNLLEFVFDQLSVQQAVLDPYMGSGSTGVVAIRRGLPFVGCEIDEKHFEVAFARLSKELAKREAA